MLSIIQNSPQCRRIELIFDPWGWGVILALDVVQAIFNALFYKNLSPANQF